MKRVFAAFVAVSALLSAGCADGSGAASSDEEVIKIGVINSDNGAYAFAGSVAHEAMDIAVRHVNDDGGIAGRRLELDFRDNSSDIAQAVTLTGTFASDPDYLAIIGPTSTPESLAVAPVANDRRIPLIGATVVGGAMLESGPWVFKTAANSDSILADLATLAVSELGITKIAVVYGRENEAQVDQRNAFVTTAEAAGAKIVTDIGVLNKDTNFADVARRVVAAEPDGLFVALTGDATANVIVQTKRGGLSDSVTLLGTSQSISKEYLTVGGDDVNGTIAATDYGPTLDTEMNKRFVKDYQAAYGKLPDAYGAMGYQAIIMIKNAIESIDGDITRESLRDALTRNRSFEGVLGTGTTQVNDRVPTYGSAILKIENGEFGPYSQ